MRELVANLAGISEQHQNKKLLMKLEEPMLHSMLLTGIKITCKQRKSRRHQREAKVRREVNSD